MEDRCHRGEGGGDGKGKEGHYQDAHGTSKGQAGFGRAVGDSGGRRMERPRLGASGSKSDGERAPAPEGARGCVQISKSCNLWTPVCCHHSSVGSHIPHLYQTPEMCPLDRADSCTSLSKYSSFRKVPRSTSPCRWTGRRLSTTVKFFCPSRVRAVSGRAPRRRLRDDPRVLPRRRNYGRASWHQQCRQPPPPTPLARRVAGSRHALRPRRGGRDGRPAGRSAGVCVPSRARPGGGALQAIGRAAA